MRYYVYGSARAILLIESADSMIEIASAIYAHMA